MRNGKDLPALLAIIAASGIFGHLGQFPTTYPEAQIAKRPRAREWQATSPKDAIFGFWNPHGFSDDWITFDIQFQLCFQRAAAIEAAYIQTERVPSGVLALEFRRPDHAAAAAADEAERERGSANRGRRA